MTLLKKSEVVRYYLLYLSSKARQIESNRARCVGSEQQKVNFQQSPPQQIMKPSTKNTLAIAIYILAAVTSSNILGTLFWNFLSIAFLIAGTYGIVCMCKKKKFLF
ncbi:MAG: hypothetical protein KKF39_01580 [Nanoarchaeota archaeon]|nr:hypothetical protein [Nanoarchaeota archaeon]